MSEKVPVGVLLSGSGTNLQAILDAAADPAHPARVAVVISNRRDAFGLERAREAGVPALWIPHKGKSREEHETELLATLREHGCSWVALAGYMRLLGATFLDGFPGRVLNIHPALLPAFPGVDGQGQAHAHGVRIAGCTVHFVDGGTDTGPIIAQGAVPVLPGDTRDSLQARILKVEHVLYPRAIGWAVEGRLAVVGRKVELDLAAGDQGFVWGG
jgi:phosphoribosylglycinamide formyltransferase-1